MMRATKLLFAGWLSLMVGVVHAEEEEHQPMQNEVEVQQIVDEPAPAAEPAATEATPKAAAPVQPKAAPAPAAAEPVAYPDTPTPKRNDPNRPRDLDLRRCLSLGDAVAISKCAGE